MVFEDIEFKDKVLKIMQLVLLLKNIDPWFSQKYVAQKFSSVVILQSKKIENTKISSFYESRG